jgi:hypothetical protein
LLSDNTAEAVANSIVFLVSSDTLGGVLNLEEELDSLDRGDKGL